MLAVDRARPRRALDGHRVRARARRRGSPPSLSFCSRCGTELEPTTPPDENRERLACPACGYIAYVNPRLVVTTLPVTDAGELVLIRRGIEPGYGSWAQPGGFLEVDETVGEAAVRETLEETGLLVEPGELVGLYSRLEAAVVTLAFEARIVGGAPRTYAESLEVTAFAAGRDPVAGDRVQDELLGASATGCTSGTRRSTCRPRFTAARRSEAGAGPRRAASSSAARHMRSGSVVATAAPLQVGVDASCRPISPVSCASGAYTVVTRVWRVASRSGAWQAADPGRATAMTPGRRI